MSLFTSRPGAHPARRRGLAALTVLLGAALALSACSGTGATEKGGGSQLEDGAASSDTGAFPVSITDAFRTTVVKKKPTRVVTWGWGSTEAAIALGTTPVAMQYQSYGADANGVLPWVKKALQKKGATMPTVLPNSSDDPPYEAIAAAKPDLILAPYSGLTKKQDQLLEAIAPTVAYPDKPWATPWQNIIRITAKALGETKAADSLLKGIDAKIAAAGADHPDLKGKTVAMVWDSAGTFYVYRTVDPRVQFVQGLGLKNAPSVEKLANGSQSFYYTLSHEKVSQLTSDILVSFADNKKDQKAFLDSSWGKSMRQVKEGTVAQVTGSDLISAVSPPTALSLTWGLKKYVAALSAAASHVK